MRTSRKLILIAGALAALAVPSVANASVTVNPDGSGFVGKGDVQSALGFNNKQMQDSDLAQGFAWTQAIKITYNFSWATASGEQRHMTWTLGQTRPMAAAEARNNSNGKDGSLTGWNLTGAGAWTPMVSTWTGEDYNHDGVVGQTDNGHTDVYADGYGPMSTTVSYTYTDNVNGKPLPGVILPAGVVPPTGVTPVA